MTAAMGQGLIGDYTSLKTRLPDLQQKILRTLWRLRHASFKLIMRVRLITHKLCALGPQLCNADGQRTIVFLACRRP